MNKQQKGFFALGLIAYFLSVAACSKPSELGLSLVEQERSDIIYTDTLSLEMNSYILPTQVTSGQIRTLCGAVDDPIFGHSEASIYMNFRITSTNVSFPTTKFDSVVLMMVYDTMGHYGNVLMDNSEIQTWEVLRLEELMDINEDYKSDKTFAVGSPLTVGDVQFIPQTEDSIDISEANTVVRKPAHLRVRLDDAFGLSLMYPADPTIYSSNENFKDFFKGICVRPKAGANNSSILRFRSKHVNTKISVYYTDTVPNPTGGGNTTVIKKFDLMSDEDAESVINIIHDYSSTPVLDSNITDTVVYIQGMAGAGVRVAFPHLDSLGDIIINKAELVVYAIDGNSDTFPVPRQMVCLEKLVDGTYDYVDDVLTSFARLNTYTLFGGLLNEKDEANVYYQMNISEYMQRVVNGDTEELAVYLQTSSVIDPSRTRIGNQRNVLKPAKLLLTYTKLN